MMKKKSVSVSLMLLFGFLLIITKPEMGSAARNIIPLSNILLAQQLGIETEHPLTCGALGQICHPFSPCCRNCNCYGVCVSKGFPYDIHSCD